MTSTSAGVDSVSFPAVWSQDVGTLVLQDLPRRRHHPDRYPDRHVLALGACRCCTTRTPAWRPGSSHTYTYQAYDGDPRQRQITGVRAGDRGHIEPGADLSADGAS